MVEGSEAAPLALPSHPRFAAVVLFEGSEVAPLALPNHPRFVAVVLFEGSEPLPSRSPATQGSQPFLGRDARRVERDERPLREGCMPHAASVHR